METTKHAKPLTYVLVFVALAVVTAVEVFVGQGLPAEAKLIVLLALAVVKAILVMMFFMHLKYDTKWYSRFLIFPLFMAVLLTVIVIIHYSTF
jgi:caa(3)-type oxidase subunit IV